jgi:hypothetical protein
MQEVDKSARQTKNNFHLAGIVPVAKDPFDFNMPWHDSLMPISQNYLAVERAVYECGMAGCETIWLVCHKETTPLIRHRIGDYILDPTINFSSLRRFYKTRCEQHLKPIPIYYVPIHPKDRDLRDGLTWSIIYGYKRAYHISRSFSRWAAPSKYYVSFPYGVFPPSDVKDIRKKISSKQSVFFSTPDGLTAKDNAFVPFTFDSWEYSGYRQSFLNHENRRWKEGKWEDGKFTGVELPPEERFNGSQITLSQFLETANINEENTFSTKWHYDISSWENYCSYLASEESKHLRRPKFGLTYKEFNPLAIDPERLDENVEE